MHNNYKHVPTTCPECKHDTILQDTHRQEIFCDKCGLILHDNSIIRITIEIEKKNNEIKFIRDLWRKEHYKE